MPTLLETIRAVFAAAWRSHFAIPEPVYWFVVVLAGVGFSAASPVEAIGWTAVIVLGVQGIARWHYHRGRGRRALVLARFVAPGGAHSRGAEVQHLFLTRLRDKLAPAHANQVHAVPAIVGTADQRAAASLRRRLRARLLIYGRVTEDSSGWGVFARIMAPVGGGHHFDEHTRDATPIKRSWGERVELLSPTERVMAEEYPLIGAAEVESLIRGSAGQVALLLDEPERARKLLEEALAVVPGSESPAIDGLRVAWAHARLEQGRADDALALLRSRARQATASAELLRELSRTLALAAELGLDRPDRLWRESVAALRQAATSQADPQHDMTLFNLAALLGASSSSSDRSEGLEIVRGLERTSKRYARAWYLHRMLGSASWSEAATAMQSNRPAEANTHYREAGRRYRRAIRLRPRVGILVWMGARRVLWTVYPPAPILHANLADVHDSLGQGLRSSWRWWRCERKRDRLIRRGMRRFAAGQWEMAYANFDWVIVGRGDFRDIVGLVYSAVAAHQTGDRADAIERWQHALAQQPFALVTRAAMLRDPEHHPLEHGLPGTETTDLDQIAQQLGIPVPPPGPVPVGGAGCWRRLFPRHEPTGGG